jgi:hypothetical protein
MPAAIALCEGHRSRGGGAMREIAVTIKKSSSSGKISIPVRTLLK